MCFGKGVSDDLGAVVTYSAEGVEAAASAHVSEAPRGPGLVGFTGVGVQYESHRAAQRGPGFAVWSTSLFRTTVESTADTRRGEREGDMKRMPRFIRRLGSHTDPETPLPILLSPGLGSSRTADEYPTLWLVTQT